MGAGERKILSLRSSVSSVKAGTNSATQEGWLAENAVSEEDKLASEKAKLDAQDRPEDPMQGLEGLDVAGPKPE